MLCVIFAIRNQNPRSLDPISAWSHQMFLIITNISFLHSIIFYPKHLSRRVWALSHCFICMISFIWAFLFVPSDFQFIPLAVIFSNEICGTFFDRRDNSKLRFIFVHYDLIAQAWYNFRVSDILYSMICLFIQWSYHFWVSLLFIPVRISPYLHCRANLLSNLG